MTLGIMQPYFLPYLGYFSLIKHTDEFVLFDAVQFIRHGWIERNRILKQGDGWMYIQVPLIKEHGRDTLIKDVLINNSENWKGKILAQLQPYKKIAPYYRRTIDIVNDIFSKEHCDIVNLNREALIAICSYLNINRQFPVFSQMGLTIDTVNAPDEWALSICKSIGAEGYINPQGGLEFFDRSKYIRAGIDIKFQQMNLTPYQQGRRETFESGLSIIDVMMFNSPEEINGMLDNFILL